jgi:hypothetical protein
VKVCLDLARTHLISGFVDTYLRLSEPEERVFELEMSKLEGREQEGIMQIVTSWMEQGIEQGIEQGERSLILRLLKRQIGLLTPEIESQICTMPLPQLEALGDALLNFSSSADLQNWLGSHS